MPGKIERRVRGQCAQLNPILRDWEQKHHSPTEAVWSLEGPLVPKSCNRVWSVESNVDKLAVGLMAHVGFRTWEAEAEG